jgi:molybdopterin molybdotransferase
MLRKLQGDTSIYHTFLKAVNSSDFKTKKGRVNVVLGTILNGEFKVTRNNKYGSGMITALYESNCILVTNENTQNIQSNQEVKVIPFDSQFDKNQTNIFN